MVSNRKFLLLLGFYHSRYTNIMTYNSFDKNWNILYRLRFKKLASNYFVESIELIQTSIT